MNKKPLFGIALAGAALATFSSAGAVLADETTESDAASISTASSEQSTDQQITSQEAVVSETQNNLAQAEADVAKAQADVTNAVETNQAIDAADQAVDEAKTQLDQEESSLETDISEDETAVAEADKGLQEAIQADAKRQTDIDAKQTEIAEKQAAIDSLKNQLGSNSSAAEIIETHDMEAVLDAIYKEQEQDGYTTARLNGSGEPEVVTIVADPNAYSFNESNYDTYLRQYIRDARNANGINTSVPTRSESAQADAWAQARADEEIAEDNSADHETSLDIKNYISDYPNGTTWWHSSEDVSVTSKESFNVGSDQELAYYIVMRYLTEYMNIKGTASDMTNNDKAIFGHAISVLAARADEFGVGAALDNADDGNDYFDTVLEFILFDNNPNGDTIGYIKDRFTASKNDAGEYVLNFDGKEVKGLPYTTFQYVTENYATYLNLENQIVANQKALDNLKQTLSDLQATPEKTKAAEISLQAANEKLKADRDRLAALRAALTSAQANRAALPANKIDVAPLEAVLASAKENLANSQNQYLTELSFLNNLRASQLGTVYQGNDPESVIIPVNYNNKAYGVPSQGGLPTTGDDSGYLAGVVGAGLLMMALGLFPRKREQGHKR
ncbi:LPXTG cell wall anchor domain-containing protein [Streptococcus dentiloxodontae]